MTVNRRLIGASILSLAVVAGAAVFFAEAQRPSVAPASRHVDRPRRVPATTTSTTVAPGELPQTKVFPSASDPAFIQRLRDLVRAAALDRPGIAMRAFFPLAAYVQVKAIADPVTDWHDRLVANYRTDIGLIHAQMGPHARQARFVSASVPATAAVWVLPGVEYNKGSYWRVYDTAVTYREGSVTGQFTITSMISWRGEWYVVHLGAIR